MLTVTITKKHTIGTRYDSLSDDALIKAVKEQLKEEIDPKAVFDDYLLDKKNNIYEFDTSEKTGYCRQSFEALKAGQIQEIKLTLTISAH